MTILPALLIDLLFGDPPNRLHPTAWMGSLIAVLTRLRPHGKPLAELLFGACLVIGGGLMLAGIGWLLLRLFATLPPLLRWLAEGAALKITFSLRSLDRAASEVQSALEDEDLGEGRRLLSWHLVSRDTSQLSSSQTAAAAIESVAENASDGLVAPLFFYTLGGLPLALAYRFVNTADSMLGYHDAEREWLGKIPARLDDLLNLIPARLTGLLIVLAAYLSGNDGSQAWKIMWRDSRRTASPNAGVPMSAMAGALGVELEKVGYYQLGIGSRAPSTNDLGRARHMLTWTAGLAGAIFIAMSFYAGR